MDPADPDVDVPDDWREIEHINRPRGILSPKERAHIEGLLDEDPKEDADAIRQREYRIRQHIYNAFLDFTILAASELALEPLDEVGRELSDVSLESEHPHGVYTGVQNLMEMLYVSLGAFHPPDGSVTFTSILRETIIDSLIGHYAVAHNSSVLPVVEYDIYIEDECSLNEVMEIYDRYPETYLLPEELDALRRGGKITREEYQEHISEMQDMDHEKELKKRAEAYENRGYGVEWNSDGSFDVIWSNGAVSLDGMAGSQSQ